MADRLAGLPPPDRAAYFLDFDGTLVEIAPAPDLVHIDPELAHSLRRLRGVCGDAVAIVSGRPIGQIEAFLPDAPYALAGEHGTAFRLAPGAAITGGVTAAMPDGWLQTAAALAAAHLGAMLEPKGHGFALHYRSAPLAGAALQAGLQRLLAQHPGSHELMAAKMAWEVRPLGADKGAAVRILMRSAPFAGRVPIFVGDDVTDEDGMAAARAMGGVGLRVDEVFGDPAGVRAWIAAIAAIL